MSTSTPTQSTLLPSSVPSPQPIQIQLPVEVLRLPAPPSSAQGDLSTFTVVIGLVILAKTLLGNASSK